MEGLHSRLRKQERLRWCRQERRRAARGVPTQERSTTTAGARQRTARHDAAAVCIQRRIRGAQGRAAFARACSAVSLTLPRMPDVRGERPTDPNHPTNTLQVLQARYELDLLLRSQRSRLRASSAG